MDEAGRGWQGAVSRVSKGKGASDVLLDRQTGHLKEE